MKTTLTCVRCKTKVRKLVVYGRPIPEVLEEAERGNVVLGGCNPEKPIEDWVCDRCDALDSDQANQPGPTELSRRFRAVWAAPAIRNLPFEKQMSIRRELSEAGNLEALSAWIREILTQAEAEAAKGLALTDPIAKVIAQSGPDDFLVVYTRDIGHVVRFQKGKPEVFPEFNPDSILARGYWEEVVDEELAAKALLATTREKALPRERILKDLKVDPRERMIWTGERGEMVPSQCNDCLHYRSDGTCRSFPHNPGIPHEILTNEWDHREEYAGDRGFLWIALEGEVHPNDRKLQEGT